MAAFVLPFGQLLYAASGHLGEVRSWQFLSAAWNSFLLALVAALVTVAIGVVLAYAGRALKSRLISSCNVAVRVGYAMPGTVLALGLMLPLAWLDNAIDGLMRQIFGISSGLLLSGTIAILLLAYVIRYLAVAIGAIEAGLDRRSPNLDAAARTLGESTASALRRVHLRLLGPSIGVAAILVFVDTMKELPATLLLRPFNFDTLATTVYAQVALEQFERAAPGAIAIVLVGLAPMLLHRTMSRGPASSRH